MGYTPGEGEAMLFSWVTLFISMLCSPVILHTAKCEPVD